MKNSPPNCRLQLVCAPPGIPQMSAMATMKINHGGGSPKDGPSSSGLASFMTFDVTHTPLFSVLRYLCSPRDLHRLVDQRKILPVLVWRGHAISQHLTQQLCMMARKNNAFLDSYTLLV